MPATGDVAVRPPMVSRQSRPKTQSWVGTLSRAAERVRAGALGHRDGERRPAPDLALERDRAAVILDGAFRDREAEAGAGAVAAVVAAPERLTAGFSPS